MQASRHTPRSKGPKFLDTKVLIASLSVAVTFGMWNLLSNEAVQAEKITPTPAALPPQPPDTSDMGLPPIPTLIPVVEVQVPSHTNVVQASQPQDSSAAPTGKLRSVGVPTVTIVQKFKPVVADLTTVSGGGGGGGGGGGAARTRSSRK